ncbi:MAG: adenylate cyclase [Verrucomicrobiaceae bacterium]|nr:MAG: adenylate cyclase [Verrucomicrobiaceae bacterium]
MNSLRLLWSYTRARRNAGAGRWKTREALERWQDTAVRRHLAWVMRYSPYYRELYAGLDLRSWRDFPIIGKQEMMDNFSRLNTAGLDLGEALRVAQRAEETRDFRPMVKGFTVGLSSGTSGSRGLFAASAAERAEWAGTLLARVLPRGLAARGQRAALFLRSNSNLYRSIQSRRLSFHYFDLLRPWEELLERFEAFAPTLLVAPPSALRRLAEARTAGRISARPDKICAAAEVLEPQDATFIAAAFGHRMVHGIYQATEGFLGATCAYGTMHLNEDVMVIQREELGEGRFAPIITDFRRRTQPVIRHRLNDVLRERRTPCPCGSLFTALEAVEGRCDDLLVFERVGGAAEIFPDFIRLAVITAHPAIEEYSVVQDPENAGLRVALKTPPPLAGEAARAVEQSLRRFWENQRLQPVPLRFEPWSPPEPGQKLRRIFRTPPHPT